MIFFNFLFKWYECKYDESFEFNVEEHLKDEDNSEKLKELLKYIQMHFGNKFKIYQASV